MSLFGGPKTQASKTTVASGVKIQSSVYGAVVPVVYGQTRITGNLIWYGDFKAIAQNSNQSGGGKGGGGGGGGKGSGGGSTSYDYKASFFFALCSGPIVGVANVWSSKSGVSWSQSNLGLITGNIGQAPAGWMSSLHPTEALGYSGIAYVYGQSYDLGNSAQMPNLTYEVEGGYGGAISGLPDSDPKDVVTDVLTNPYYGVGFPSARLGDLSTFSSYCRATGLVISPAFDTQQDAATLLNDIVGACNAEFVWSGDKLTIVPYGDQNLSANGATYAAPSTPLFSLTDDDFINTGQSSNGGQGDPVQLSRARPSDRMNSVKLEWRDRTNQYNTSVVEAQDQAAIQVYGLRGDQPRQTHYFCVQAAAMLSAQLQLGRQAVRNIYTFTVGWRYCLLDPMDIIEITDAKLGLVQQWVRVQSIEEDDNGNLKVTAEEYLGGAGHAPAYSWQGASPFVADYNVAPGSVNQPMICEPPPALTGGRPQVWIGASGSSANWGGCDIWLSLDNSTYERIGRVATPARQGILHTPLPSGSDPDTVNACVVDPSESGMTLLGGTQADADSYRTLFFVCDNGTEANGEFISYENAALISGGYYSLTYLRRGAYGSTIAAHAAGSQFCRIDQAIFEYDLPVQPVDYRGKTLYLKFTSFNHYGGGEEQLANVPAYTYVPAGVGAYIIPPTGCMVAMSYVQQPDGTVHPFMNILWTPTIEPFFDGYEIQYHAHGSPNVFSVKVSKTTDVYQVGLVATVSSYDAQVRAYRNTPQGQLFSAWSVAGTTNAVGKTTPPPAPTGLSASGGYRQIALKWTASAENDIDHYEVWRSPTSSFSSATALLQVKGTSIIDTGLGLSDTFWYWVRAVDTSGNFSSYNPSSTVAGVVATTLPVDSSDITGQIVNAQIAAGAIAGLQLADGAVTEGKIAPAAVVTSKLYVGDTTNLIQDPNFLDTVNSWIASANGNPAGNVYFQTGTSGANQTLNANTIAVFACHALTANEFVYPNYSLPQAYIPVDNVNFGYRHRVYLGASGPAAFTNQFILALNAYDTNKTYLGTHQILLTQNTMPSNPFNYEDIIPAGTLPTGTAFVIPVYGVTGGNAGVGGYFFFSQPTLERIVNGTLIADGAITTPKITTGSITAALIAGGTITADKLAVNFLNFATISSTANPTGQLIIRGGDNGDGNGPFIRAYDGTSGVTRAWFGRHNSDWGIWVYNSLGTLVFSADGLGVAIVGTSNIADNAVTYDYGITVAPGNTILWSHTADASGQLVVFATLAIQNNSGGTGFSSGQMRLSIGGTIVATQSYTVGPTGVTVPFAAKVSVGAGQSILVQLVTTSGEIDALGGALVALIVQK